MTLDTVADGVETDGDDADALVPGVVRLTLVGGAVQAPREVARLMRPGEADAPTPREALANAIGSRMTPLRLPRLSGVTLHAEKDGESVGIVLAGRVHVGRPRGSASRRSPRRRRPRPRRRAR